MATHEKETIWRTTGIALAASLITVGATQAVQAMRDDRTWRRDHRLQELQSQVAKAREAMDLTDSIIRQGSLLEAGMRHDRKISDEWHRAIREAGKTGKWKKPNELPHNTVAEMIGRLDADGPRLALILHEVWITDGAEEPFKAYGAWVSALDALTGANWAVIDPDAYQARFQRITPEEATKRYNDAVEAEALARKHLKSEVDNVWARMLERLHRSPDEVRFVEAKAASK